jgi:hypothetical protein
MNAPAAASETRYDLYSRTGNSRFYFHNDNLGVTLTSERLAWIDAGQSHSAPFKDIASVHLQSGGEINQCLIRFVDGHLLTITDANAYGIVTEQQTPVYRTFMHDLHARLVASGVNSIRFTAGYMGARHRVVMVGALLLGLICFVGPLVMLVVTGEFKLLLAAVTGGGLCWTMIRTMQNNVPRDYDPNRPPEELLR